MTHTRDALRSMTLTVLVVLSVVAGAVAFVGNASAAPNNLSIVSEQPVDGSGAVTVEAVTSPNETVSFKVADSTGTTSGTRVVTDGGPEDQAPSKGVVRTALDLGTLFDGAPASGTGHIYAGSGDGFDIAAQTFDTKTQVTIDADEPTATVTHGASGRPGDQVKVGYTATDDPQKMRSITMTLVGPDDTEYVVPTDLQPGENNAVQFEVPSNASAGAYDIELVVVDEVGHRTTDTLRDGFVVT